MTFEQKIRDWGHCRETAYGHDVTSLVHQEGFVRFTICDGLLHEKALFVQFPTQGGAASVLLAGEFAFQPALKGDKKAASSLHIEEYPAMERFEVGRGTQRAVTEEIECHRRFRTAAGKGSQKT